VTFTFCRGELFGRGLVAEDVHLLVGGEQGVLPLLAGFDALADALCVRGDAHVGVVGAAHGVGDDAGVDLHRALGDGEHGEGAT
jgi:hypothetical protein